MNLEQQVMALQAELDALRTLPRGLPYVPQAPALSSTSYDGNDTVNVGVVTLDTSAVFGAPVGIKAAVVRMQATWAAAAAASALRVQRTGQTASYGTIRAQTTFPQDGLAVVPCDANGDFDIEVLNANATNVTLEILGYCL